MVRWCLLADHPASVACVKVGWEFDGGPGMGGGVLALAFAPPSLY